MPLYDYRCEACKELTEISHPMGGTTNRRCPQCNGRLHKVITTFPHTELNWKAYDRNDTGSDRMVLGAASQGKPSFIDDRSQRYKVRISDGN